MSNQREKDQTRSYGRADSVVFLRTRERFGGLSNMAGGFPLRVNGIRILSSEALYQACRFPHMPEVQGLIIGQRSPMTAKMKSKPYRDASRPDWQRVRVSVMRWALRVKLAQNWEVFSRLLLSTGDRPIVEESRKDAFWGAKPVDERTLVGMNVLGRLLMELREEVKAGRRGDLQRVEPLAIPNFLLAGRPIETIAEGKARVSRSGFVDHTPHNAPMITSGVPQDLFSTQEEVHDPESRSIGLHSTHDMESELKPYPDYRKAGLRWLHHIPSHWKVQRAKTVFQPIDVRSKTGQEELLTVSSSDGIRRRSEKKVTMFQAKSYVGHKLCWPGDLVINSLWAWAKGLGISKYHGIISTAYGVYRPKKQYSTFADYFHPLLRSEAYDWEFKVRSKGIWISRLQLTDTSFLDMPVLLPPVEEAEQIGQFIKGYDQRVNRLIRAKQRLITLLNEQKQAIIQRAVTRGLDPDVPLKPSGVDWLGDVPAHWEMHAHWTIASPRKERNPGGLNLLSVFLDRGVIPYGEGGGQVHAPSLNLGNYQVVHPGDFVLNNQQAWRGSVGVSRYHGIISPAYIVLKVAESCHPEYLNYLMRSQVMVAQFLVASRGVGDIQRQLYWPHLRNVLVPLPPKEEQETIAAHLAAETREISAAISLAQSEIDLIREYRTRLIADIVTGKLDVRGVAVPEVEGAETDLGGVHDDELILDEEDAFAPEEA